MMLPYDEMRKIDVTPYCEKRDNALYLNWAKCIDLLHQNGANVVYFVPIVNPATGSSLFYTDVVFSDSKQGTNRVYETRIEIHIDENVYIMQSPVMNGANPVKDNSMSQQRVWNSMCRSFVKGVAIYTGLGFDLWLKEEEEDSKAQKADIHHEIMAVRDRVFEKMTALQKQDILLVDIANELGRTEEEIKQYLGQYKVLAAFEHNLDVVMANHGGKA